MTIDPAPVPVLFSCGKLFPQSILFGLAYNGFVHPIRTVASDKVRPLFGSKPEPIPDALGILAIGDDALAVLSEADLLEGIMFAMASDMVQAIKRKQKPKPPPPIHPFDMGVPMTAAMIASQFPDEHGNI